MPRWKNRQKHHLIRYPLIALLDLFFLLLMVFVCGSSSISVVGYSFATNAGQTMQTDDPSDEAVEQRQRRKEFNEYIVADKMILEVNADGRITLNEKAVTLESVGAELAMQKQLLLNMYRNNNQQDKEQAQHYRPKMVLNMAPNCSVDVLKCLLNEIRKVGVDAVFVTPEPPSAE